MPATAGDYRAGYIGGKPAVEADIAAIFATLCRVGTPGETIMKRFLALTGALALLGAALTAARADEKIGVVLMHGKQGVPLGQTGIVSNKRPIGGRLVADLRSAGYLVETPEMCWSGRRAFDRTFDQCLHEIDNAVEGLRLHGATIVVVGGLSQGGNAALAYGATHTDIAGVIAYAPADDPAAKARRPEVAAAIVKAQRLVAQDRGDEKTTFDDVNTGPNGSFAMTITTTPKIYLSFYGPDSTASIPTNTAKLKAPVLWIAGDSDPTQRAGKAFAFNGAPADSMNRYVTVPANHIQTPDAGRGATLAWLAELAKQR
jgi:dienelactone hydrolase